MVEEEDFGVLRVGWDFGNFRNFQNFLHFGYFGYCMWMKVEADSGSSLSIFQEYFYGILQGRSGWGSPCFFSSWFLLQNQERGL